MDPYFIQMSNFILQSAGGNKKKVEKESKKQIQKGKNEAIKNVAFYLNNEVIKRLLEEKSEGSNPIFAEGTDFSFDIIDQPMHVVIKGKKDHSSTTLYLRNQYGIYKEDSADLCLLYYRNGKKKLEKNSGRIGGAVEVIIERYLKAGEQLLKSYRKSNLFGIIKDLDPEKEGILVKTENDSVLFEKVSGKKRPTMPCMTLFGGAQMLRPYQDELIESMMKEGMSFGDKLEAAAAGDEEAMEKVALAYLNGDEEAGIEQNAEKAVYWFRKQAESDNPTGCFNLAIMYLKGDGIEQSFEQALYWMQKAEENGDDDASAHISKYKTIVELQKKADQGDAQAKADLAEQLMALGSAMDDNTSFYKMSLDLAKEAAAEKIPSAYWTLALAYEHGRGVRKNNKKAFEYFSQGAEAGHAGCLNNLAIYYRTGKAVPKDLEKAFALSLKSAEMGNYLAMRNVGECYQFGTGIEENMEKAVSWYEKALGENYNDELAQKVAILKDLINEEANKKAEEEQKKREAEVNRKMREAEERRKMREAIYESARIKMTADTIEMYESAISEFRVIPGWKDSDEQIAHCQKRIKEIEAERIERERKDKEEEEKKRKRKKRRRIITVIVVIIAIIAGYASYAVPNIIKDIESASDEYLVYLGKQAEKMLEDDKIKEYGISEVAYEISDMRKDLLGDTYSTFLSIDCKSTLDLADTSDSALSNLIKQYFKQELVLPSGKKVLLTRKNIGGSGTPQDLLSIMLNGRKINEPVSKQSTSSPSKNKKDTSNKSSSFTNKYGTPTTRCAHAGCSNYIASSGDTNCCTTHSNKCGNCGKYIDEDAMYCMDCLKDALSD